jgi:ClpP class serine protease
MAHSLFRVAEQLYNVPHLITEAGLAPIVEYLSHRNSIEFSSAIVANAQEPVKPKKLDKIGEIAIDGALTYKPVIGACGATQGVSYQSILEQAQMLIDDGVTTLITVHSSPGGQASHCFSTANDLRSLCDENGVKWYAYIDTLSASASLAINVAADEVIIHPDAQTGSIGCVVALLDKSKAMADAGLKPIYISSTPGKTPFAEDGSFSKEFLNEMQTEVTRLGNMFAEHVSKYTSVPVKDILAMDAKMFHAEAALEAGLVNKVMDHKQFSAYVAEMHKGKS